MSLRLIVPKKNYSSLMEKLSGWNTKIISKDESTDQPTVVCEMDPGYFQDCDALARNLQGRVEILAVSVHVEGDSHVDQYDDAEDFPSSSTNETQSVIQLNKTLEKHNISKESGNYAQPVKQNRCSTCNAIVGDAKEYREHFKSEWHKHNLKRRTRQLPPLSADECMTDIEVDDLKADLREYSF